MKRFNIVIARAASFVSNNSLGTDALNAIAAIPGANNVEIDRESDHEVEISYEWRSVDKFWETEEHLHKCGLRRVDW